MKHSENTLLVVKVLNELFCIDQDDIYFRINTFNPSAVQSDTGQP